MEEFWIFFKTYLSGPLVGAVIGYFTNFLAVKMLFRPYYPKKIGKLRIPFTPGIIPKRQGDLAIAVGNAVGNNLLTTEDLSNKLESDEMVNDLVNKVTNTLKADVSLDIVAKAYLGEEVEIVKDKAANKISDAIYASIVNLDAGKIICAIGKETILEKKSSMGMIGMFLTDDLIDSLLNSLEPKINEYIELNGKDLIQKEVNKKINGIFEDNLSHLTKDLDYSKVEVVIKKVWTSLVVSGLQKYLQKININGIVEAKINAMSVKELEKLCLSVMKKELNAIVNLGALIGLVIGIINIFI